mgnify:CR=1 FL=1
MNWRIGIITASDKCSKGFRKDESAQVVIALIKDKLQADIADYRIVPDEMDEIAQSLIEFSDEKYMDLIITTGGTGLSPRDVTPEATMQVIDRQVPGFAEAMRSASMQKTKRAMLSRAVCGIRGSTLIVNLPGSPKGAEENLPAIIDQFPHALQILTGKGSDHE